MALAFEVFRIYLKDLNLQSTILIFRISGLVDFLFSHNIEGSIFNVFFIIFSKFPSFFCISHNFEESISWAAERLKAHEIGRLWPTPQHKTSSIFFLVKDYLNFTPLKNYTMKLNIQRHQKKDIQVLS